MKINLLLPFDWILYRFMDIAEELMLSFDPVYRPSPLYAVMSLYLLNTLSVVNLLGIDWTRGMHLFAGGFIFLFNVFYYGAKKRQKVWNRFCGESDEAAVFGRIFAGAYFIGTFCFLAWAFNNKGLWAF